MYVYVCMYVCVCVCVCVCARARARVRAGVSQTLKRRLQDARLVEVVFWVCPSARAPLPSCDCSHSMLQRLAATISFCF